MDQNNDIIMIDEDIEDGKPAAKPSLPPVAGPVVPVANDNTISKVWSDLSGVDRGEGQQLLGELPFLVTHWLAGYHRSTADTVPAESEEQTKAVQTIEQAAKDLASAFATLGAFGAASRVSSVRLIDCSLFIRQREELRLTAIFPLVRCGSL